MIYTSGGIRLRLSNDRFPAARIGSPCADAVVDVPAAHLPLEQNILALFQ